MFWLRKTSILYSLGLYDLHLSWDLHFGVQNHFSGLGSFYV
jgi:hypothetical protein